MPKTPLPIVIAISSSHRNNSNSEAMLLECIKEIEKKGISVEIIKLRELNFLPCDGCEGCDTNEKCHIGDEMQKVYPKLFTAKAWIMATPEYWWNVSGLCKNFIDRLNAYWMNHRKYFAGKKAVIITCGGQPLEKMGFAEKYLELFFSKLHFEIVGKVKASASEQNEILKQPRVLNECKMLGKRLLQSIKEQKP